MSNINLDLLLAPKDIKHSQAKVRAKLLKDVFEVLAVNLAEKYLPGKTEIYFDGNRTIYNPVMPELQELFEKKGWRIVISGKSFVNQKDGDRTCFEITEIIYPQPAPFEKVDASDFYNK